MGDISIIARRLPDKSIEYGWSGMADILEVLAT